MRPLGYYIFRSIHANKKGIQLSFLDFSFYKRQVMKWVTNAPIGFSTLQDEFSFKDNEEDNISHWSLCPSFRLFVYIQIRRLADFKFDMEISIRSN